MVNIPNPDNKAEHTVAMRQLVSQIEQSLREKKYGKAYTLLADLGTHSTALKAFCQLRIVEDR